MASRDDIALLAVRMAAGGAAAGLAGGPAVGTAAAASIPLVEEGARAVVAWKNGRQARVLDRAAERSGKQAMDFLMSIISRDEGVALLAEVMDEASRTALEEKLDALAVCLVNGELGQGERLSSERSWTALMTAVEMPQLRVLHFIANHTCRYVGPYESLPSDPSAIGLPHLEYEANAIESAGVDEVLGPLVLDGLVTSGLVERNGGTRGMQVAERILEAPGLQRASRQLVRFTPAGLELYERLTMRGESVAGR